MTMRRLLLFSLMLFLSLPALAQHDEAKIRAAVEDRYREWIAAANKKDITAMANLYDENAVLLPKSEEPVLGKIAIVGYYAQRFANPNYVPFKMDVAWNSFHVVCDIAIATSIFEADVTRDAKQVHFRGKYILVWKKAADGSWKIFRYMYDEIPPKK
ncbi:MAG: hypothetical protein DME57_08760 [Verrucomicrobia bacterium]|nr:MAG: hypothetical protein DME57_08760 [Verrucomicrobiota bacterium]